VTTRFADTFYWIALTDLTIALTVAPWPLLLKALAHSLSPPMKYWSNS
jgi:hypothetical protein